MGVQSELTILTSMTEGVGTVVLPVIEGVGAVVGFAVEGSDAGVMLVVAWLTAASEVAASEVAGLETVVSDTIGPVEKKPSEGESIWVSAGASLVVGED